MIGGKAEQMLERMSSIASREWQNYPIALKAMYLSGMVAWSVASSKVVCEGEVLTTDPSDMVKEALQMASCPVGLKDLVRTVAVSDPPPRHARAHPSTATLSRPSSQGHCPTSLWCSRR